MLGQYGKDRAFGDVRMLIDDAFDLYGKDVFPTSSYRILHSVDEIEVAPSS